MALPLTEAETPASPVAAVGRLVRNLTFLAGGQAASWAFTIVWVVVVARKLGPVGLGQLAVALAATSLVEIGFGVGFSSLIVKEVARHGNGAGRLVGAGIIARLLLAVPAVLSMAAFITLGHFHGPQATVLWVSSVSLVANLVSGPLQDALQGLQRMEYLAYNGILAKAGITIIGTILLMQGHGVVALMWLFAGVAIANLLVSALWLAPRLSVNLRPSLSLLRRLVVGGMPYWMTGVLYTVYLSVDSVILSLLVPVRVVGWYGVSTRLFGTLLFVPTIIATAWLPRLCADFKRSPASFRDSSRAAMELVGVIALPIAAGTALVGPQVMQLLYGPAFDPAGPVIVILGLTAPATYISIIMWQILVASDRQARWTPVMAVGTVANILLNVTLIRAFQIGTGNGAVGAAVALLATEVGIAVAGLWMVYGVLSRTTVTRMLRAVIATAGMSLLAHLASPLGIAAEVVAAVVTFTGLVLVLRVVSAAEIRAVRTYAAHVRNRRFAVEP